jgi:hypothetical protein
MMVEQVLTVGVAFLVLLGQLQRERALDAAARGPVAQQPVT